MGKEILTLTCYKTVKKKLNFELGRMAGGLGPQVLARSSKLTRLAKKETLPLEGMSRLAGGSLDLVVDADEGLGLQQSASHQSDPDPNSTEG